MGVIRFASDPLDFYLERGILMVIKKMKYIDYLGVEREEPFHFNFSQREIVKLQTSINGGLDEFLKKIIDEKDYNQLVIYIEKFILDAFGERSLDGKYFNKSEELSKAFSQTEAFNDMFMEFITDAGKFAEFVRGVLPQAKIDAAVKNLEERKQLDNITPLPLSSAN